MLHGLEKLGGRLLIVDDDKALRCMLSWAFEDLGYQVIEASNFHEARLAASRHLFDCALLDFQLPDRTGQELLRSLSTLHPQLRVVMMSAQRTGSLTRDALHAGALAFFDKPLQINQVDALFSN